MGNLSVFNKRRPKQIPRGAVYVGRPTIWGNPFSKGSKDQNIADFREYACERVKRDPKWLEPLRGKHLVCWCAPANCHGDVLIELANQTQSADADEIDWDAWCEANEPVDYMLDNPSNWEVQHGLA